MKGVPWYPVMTEDPSLIVGHVYTDQCSGTRGGGGEEEEEEERRRRRRRRRRGGGGEEEED